jgi:flagellar basal body-associated protein FliL
MRQVKPLLASFALLAASCTLSVSAFSQEDPRNPQSPSTQQQQQMPQQQQPMQQEAQTFKGKIAQVNGSFVLQDETGKVSYPVDDQDQAKQYEGKDVQVVGTLDAATNTIHITNIQPLSK